MTAPAKHVWIGLAVVYVVWGSTYFGIKIAVETIPPLLAAGSRFLVAAVILAAILAWRRTSLRISRAELVATLIVGTLLLGLGVGLVHVAETRIDSSVAAMIAGTVPLQIIVLRLLSGESPARATRVSTLAGLFGLLLVVAPGLGAGSTALGLAVMISGSISWTLGSFLSKRLPLPRDPFV
jgi:drug/metabolite transporter (DMT)-like permease